MNADEMMYELGFENHLHWFKTVEEWRIMDSVVDMELHKAIHQVLLEHGWL